MSTPKAYLLNLATLPEGVTERDYALDSAFFEAMEQPEVLASDVAAHVTIDHKNEAYHLHLTAEGTMQIPCDRCLEPMDHEVDVDESIILRFGPEYDDSRDDVLVIPEDEPVLDLGQLMCDSLLLTIPMRHVHAPGACDPGMADILREHTADDDNEE